VTTRKNRYEAGKQRAAAILTAAKQVMVDGGYSQLTLRRVATEAGIPLRHLQYYYRAKHDLLRALCESICEDYIARCDALAARQHSSPKARFAACVDFLIDDNRDAFSNTLFFELWALACHDDYTNRLVDRLYSHYRNYVRDLIAAMRPKASAHAIESRAMQIVAFIEGLTLFIGRNKPQHAALRGIVKDASRSVLKIATAK
jgi:AcrR family transcriptional regulator